MNFKTSLKEYQAHINKSIDIYLPSPNAQPTRLHQAMHYSMKAGGKRLRPLLLIQAHALYPSSIDPMPAAVAIECIHTYSLIHDDLPCMDNSNLRRGQPTAHKQFDEATALLAGDALLTHAFYLIAKHYPEKPKAALELAYAAGSTRLIGGQVDDLYTPKSELTPEKLNSIHLNKTAALIQSALLIGFELSDAPQKKRDMIESLGEHLGLAFQIIDDILDITADSEQIGKTAGLDAQNEKITHPSLHGLEKSEATARLHTEKALEYCHTLGGKNQFLLKLITSLGHRLA